MKSPSENGGTEGRERRRPEKKNHGYTQGVCVIMINEGHTWSLSTHTKRVQLANVALELGMGGFYT